MNRIENLAKVLGLVICLIFAIFPEGNAGLQLTLFAVILLSIGIPHGAIDHLISNPKIDRKGLGRFLIVYLSLIAGYLIIWYFLPLLVNFGRSCVFRIITAVHFRRAWSLDTFDSILAWSKIQQNPTAGNFDPWSDSLFQSPVGRFY